MNLCPPPVTGSTHTAASSAAIFQFPSMPNARISLCTQPVHSFSFPPRPLRTAPSRSPNTIRFGSRPPLIRRSVPAHKKSLTVRNVGIVQRLERGVGGSTIPSRGCHQNISTRGRDYIIPYMVSKPDLNKIPFTGGLIKYVLGRGYFRAVPSQSGEKPPTSRPPIR